MLYLWIVQVFHCSSISWILMGKSNLWKISALKNPCWDLHFVNDLTSIEEHHCYLSLKSPWSLYLSFHVHFFHSNWNLLYVILIKVWCLQYQNYSTEGCSYEYCFIIISQGLWGQKPQCSYYLDFKCFLWLIKK